LLWWVHYLAEAGAAEALLTEAEAWALAYFEAEALDTKA
jgi:hypothetical protein